MMAAMERRTLYGTPQRSKSILTCKDKDATVANLTWVDTTHQISEIVSRSPPLLPIMIKCAEISSDPYIAAKIQPGDIMKLSRLQTVDVVQATVEFKSTAAEHLKDFDEYNGVQLPSFLTIPKSMESITFEVVRGSVRYSTPLGLNEGVAFSPKTSTLKANPPSVRFKTVMALSKHLPRFVKVIKTSRQIRQNTKIIDGHVLEIMGVHTPWATRDKFLSCRIDQPDGLVCKLDLKWKGTFDTIPDTKRYNIQDLLRVYRLPITVRVRDFSPTGWIPQKTSSQLKAVKTLDLNLTIEKEETMEFAMAISQTPSTSSSSMSSSGACHDPQDYRLMILSKNLNVNFVTSSDMTMNPKGYAEVMTRMGNIGDSMVSMVSKDIYLNEYGSPMVVVVPFSELQPKVYGTPLRAPSRLDECRSSKPCGRRASSHHYIDLDVLSHEGVVKDHDVISEHVVEMDDDDPYESLSAIQRNAERQICESVLRGEELAEYNQSEEDEAGADYTILRSPSTLISSSSTSNFWRLRLAMTDNTSYYQVPKAAQVDNDIYVTEDNEHPLEEDLDIPGMAGNFDGRRSLKSRCSDSLPRNAPPPVPIRSSLRHKTLDRTESTPIRVDGHGLSRNTSHTLGPSMKLGSAEEATSPALAFQNRKSVAGHKHVPDAMMSSLLLEMRSRHSSAREPVFEALQDESEIVAEKPEKQSIDDIPPPLPPPRVMIDSCYDDVVLPPPPVGSPSLPSPPYAGPDHMQNLADLPIADFPPPLPGRSSSLASLSSIASMTSVASAASSATSSSSSSSLTALAASPASAALMKSATSLTSIDSLISISSTVSTPENHCFQDALKTLKANNGNHFPTLPHKRPEARDRLQEKSSFKINRSQSCSPNRLRNLKAARRKLPELPIPEQQPEVPPITNFTVSEPQPTSRRPRPSSSGNILEESRDLPPLPTDRASSMENLLHHDEDNRVSQRPPPTPPRHLSSNHSLKARGRRSYFPSNHAKKQNPFNPIPIANIAPRPSPLDTMIRSLTKSRDRVLPAPPDTSAEQHGTSTEDGDDDDDDDDDNYLDPQVDLEQMRCDKAQKYSPSTKRNRKKIPTPPRVTKKSTSLPRNSIKSLKDIPVDIATLSCSQIAQALALLNIREDIIDNLKSVQMNGELLKSMSEEILQSEFHMSQFYAIKVIKFVNGWRP